MTMEEKVQQQEIMLHELMEKNRESKRELAAYHCRSKEDFMKCYKSGGCGVYENRSCYECPASKPEYLKRYEFPDKGLVEKLRLYGSTQPNGQMGDDCRIPKNVLLQAADRIEVLSGVRAASS